MEQQKQKEELDQMKFRFFTNISHEFRTPLTLIITPLSVIINESENENLKGKLMSIYNNAQKLLALVNQLLDFRKLEVKGEKINLGYGEISDFHLPVLYKLSTNHDRKKHKFQNRSSEIPHIYVF